MVLLGVTLDQPVDWLTIDGDESLSGLCVLHHPVPQLVPLENGEVPHDEERVLGPSQGHVEPLGIGQKSDPPSPAAGGSILASCISLGLSPPARLDAGDDDDVTLRALVAVHRPHADGNLAPAAAVSWVTPVALLKSCQNSALFCLLSDKIQNAKQQIIKKDFPGL